MDGHLKRVNPAATDTLGYSPAEVLDKPYADFIHPDDVATSSVAFRMLSSGAPVTAELRVKTKDGSYKWIEFTGFPTPQENLFYTAGRDITDRKQAEKELSGSEQWFRNTFDYAPVGMAIQAPDGRLLRANPALCTLLGYSEHELRGKHCTELVHPKDAEKGLAEVRRLLRGELPFVRLDQRYLKKNGERGWAYITASIVRDSENRPLHLVVQVIDVTGRKELEEALHASEAALTESQEELRALTGDLISAQENERRRISRELHDDLNQQLAVLSLDVGEIERGCTECPEPVRQGLGRLQHKLGDLSDHVRSIAHQLHPAVLDYVGLAAAVESLCYEFSRFKKISVSFTKIEVPDFIPEDISLCLYRISQEALANVAKHTRASHAAVTLRSEGGGIALIVDHFGGTFDPDAARSRRGLGLISMEERVRLVNGRLSFTPTEAGVRLEVWAPLPTGAGTYIANG
jgi:PAS domain S-box-containing protein